MARRRKYTSLRWLSRAALGQLTHLGQYLQDCTLAAACCLALREHGHLRPLWSTGAALSMDEWLLLLGELEASTAPTYARSYSHGQLVALALSGAGITGGYALLFFEQSPPPASALRAAVELVSYALRTTQRATLLRQRTLQLERQQAARLREIKDSRNYLRGIIDNIAVGLLLIDSDGTLRAINTTLARRFGCTPADLVGLHYSQRLDSWEQSPAATTLASGKPAARRLELVQPDGVRALMVVSSFPLIAANGTIQRAVEVWDDITEQTAMQNQLVRAEKLAALGQLSASVAHEVGNPLQAVQGFIALFLESCPPDVANRYYLHVAEQEIERVARVVARLRDFYRPSADVSAAMQVNQLLDDVLLLTSKQLQHSRIRVERDLAPELPPVLGVADQLKQVLLNLVLNAIESMPQGGRLYVTTGLQRQSGGQSNTPGEQAVEIVIADTGLGIAPERLSQLFDGLQTTKARGMGLGLYTSKAIIDRHMGRIAVSSNPGQGTRFTIMLPALNEEC